MLTNVDRSAYPDLVIYLDMRVRTFGGIKSLLGLGPVLARFGIDGALDAFRAALSHAYRGSPVSNRGVVRKYWSP